MKQLAELSKNPNESFSVGMDGENIFKWNVLVVGPPDSMYEGGFFKSVLEFPNDFPNSPPVMTFTSTMWHPNSKWRDLLGLVGLGFWTDFFFKK